MGTITLTRMKSIKLKLEKVKEATLTVRRHLGKSVAIPTHRTLGDVVLGNAWGGPRTLRAGSTVPVFLGLPDRSSLPNLCAESMHWR